MARSTYAPKEQYTGDGGTIAYTFDFKLEDDGQLLVIILDDNGDETERGYDDAAASVSTVVRNTGGLGGTVTLTGNLTTDYKIFLLEANDAPTQPYEFRNKNTFTLKRFEDAIDFVVGSVQRLMFLSLGSLRIHATDDETTFDGELPEGIANQGDKIITVNSAGDGFDYGPTVTSITSDVAAAAASAAAASASETAAASSASAASSSASAADASATAAAASAVLAQAAATLAPTAIQTLGASVPIVIVKAAAQYVRVQSTGGTLAMDTQPFGSDPALFQDGMEIVVECVDATAYHTLAELNGQYGFQGNGGLPLRFPNIITFLYNETKERFLIKSTGAF